jgi:hypothetical protein
VASLIGAAQPGAYILVGFKLWSSGAQAATTGQRLVQISKLSSRSAGRHLLAISQLGSTASERLVDYSSLDSAKAKEHLMDQGTG